MPDISNHINTFPSQIAMLHDKAQSLHLKKINGQISQNNKIVRNYLYPLIHKCSSAFSFSDKESNYDLSEILKEFDVEQLNKLYKEHRKELMENFIEKSNIQDGTLYELLPEDLTQVSPHELNKIKCRAEDWLKNCQDFNNLKTQDLYTMVQIGIVILSCFQHMQRELGQSGNHMVQNQKT